MEAILQPVLVLTTYHGADNKDDDDLNNGDDDDHDDDSDDDGYDNVDECSVFEAASRISPEQKNSSRIH